MPIQKPSKLHYVYELINPLTTKPFYVGKSRKYAGTSRKRANRFLKHVNEALNFKKGKLTHTVNQHKCNTILQILAAGKDVGFNILFESDDFQIVNNFEIKMIAEYGRKTNNTGILTNLCDGGEGVVNWVPNEEFRNKVSARMKGDRNPFFGKKLPDITRRRISETHKDLYARGELTVSKHLYDPLYIKRLVEASALACSIPVVQIDPNTGKIINRFKSANAASVSMGASSSGTLSSVITKNSGRTYLGYYWRHETCSDIVDGVLTGVEELNRKRLAPRGSKSVRQYDDNMNIIKIWDSATAAMTFYNKNPTNLNWYITNKKKYVGFFWDFN